MSTVIHTIENPQVVPLLASGAVGVIPSDTQYGLMTTAGNAMAVEKLYRIKDREHKPGTLIGANLEQFVELGLKARYLKAVEHFWPNPLSVIIPAGPELHYLHQGMFGLAVRIPKDEMIQKLLLQCGPLITTSANLPGSPPANTIKEAFDYFDDRVDFYVDGGDLSDRKPSTVIRIIDDAIEVIRSGAININEATGEIQDDTE